MTYKKQPIPNELRQAVFERDGWRCRYCGKEVKRPHADHVYAERHGGATIIENLVTACQSCNNKKKSKIGVWPKPIGYFNDQHKTNNDFVRRLKGVLYLGLFSMMCITPLFIAAYTTQNEAYKQLFLMALTITCGFVVSGWIMSGWLNR